MNNQPLLSVIIPVYKVENYLQRCLDSIINQTYKNLEIILVDDGSPDNSGKICDEYAQKDRRIKVIHQKNKGLSGARNSGLKISKGEYLAFLDSDDWIEPEMYTVLIELIEENNLDMARCSIDQTDGKNNKIILPLKRNADKLIKDKRIFELYFDEFLCKVVWNAVYKRAIVENVYYPEGLQSEDNYASGMYLFNCKRVMITTQILHHYWQNPNSITNSNTLRKSDICICTKLLIDNLQKKGLNDIFFINKLHKKLARELYHYVRDRDWRCKVTGIKKEQIDFIKSNLDFRRYFRFILLINKYGIKIYD